MKSTSNNGQDPAWLFIRYSRGTIYQPRGELDMTKQFMKKTIVMNRKNILAEQALTMATVRNVKIKRIPNVTA